MKKTRIIVGKLVDGRRFRGGYLHQRPAVVAVDDVQLLAILSDAELGFLAFDDAAEAAVKAVAKARDVVARDMRDSVRWRGVGELANLELDRQADKAAAKAGGAKNKGGK